MDRDNQNNSPRSNPSESELQRSEASSGPNPTSSSPGREGAGAERTFRCADVGNADCRWEAKGRTEDELMTKINQHAREAHGMTSIDDRTRSRIKDSIRERAA